MTTIFDIFKEAFDSTASIEPTLEIYFCDECRDVEVEKPGDLCPRCTKEWEQGYRVLSMGGRCANGAELDHGTLTHALVFGSHNAVCGAKPGRRSIGWTIPRETEVTCPRCLKRLNSEPPSRAMGKYLRGELRVS